MLISITALFRFVESDCAEGRVVGVCTSMHVQILPFVLSGHVHGPA